MSLAVGANEQKQGAVDSVSLTVRRVQGHQAKVVTVNLNSTKLVVKPLMTRRGTRLPARQLLGARPPLAAVTGAFFDMKTGLVVGSVAYRGRLLAEGATGSTLALDARQKARLLPAAGRMGRYVDWSDFQMAVSAGPTLVHHGRLAVNPSSEGFSDPGLFGPRRRTALGVTKSNRLLMVGVDAPVSIHTLARMMRELGCVEALNMDGGTSSTLFYRGQMLVEPNRPITNLVAVYAVGRDGRSDPLSSPLQPLRHYQRGLEKMWAGRLVEARSHLSMAVALAPVQGRYRSALAGVEARLGHRTAAVEHYLRAARLCQDQGKATDALTHVRKAVALTPWRADVQLTLARTARAAGQKGLARQAARVVLAAHPGHPAALKLSR